MDAGAALRLGVNRNRPVYETNALAHTGVRVALFIVVSQPSLIKLITCIFNLCSCIGG